MLYGNRIKEIRESVGLTQEKFGEATEVNKQVLYNFEKNRSEPSNKFLSALSDKFKVDINWLITGKGEMFLGTEETSLAKKEDVIYVKMPDVSVSAGRGIENFEDFPEEKIVAISRELIGVEISNPKECMIVRVFGNSMQPKIDNGDAIFVQKLTGTPLYFEGSFLVNYGGQLLVKNVQFKKGRVVLVSLNKEYEDIVVENYEESEIPLHIIGKVLTVLKPF